MSFARPTKGEPNPTELEREREHWRSVQIIRLQQNGEDVRARLAVLSDTALAGLKTLQIINGGAIIALFTVMAQGSDSSFVSSLSEVRTYWAFASFAAGLTLGVAAFALGYAGQNEISQYEEGVVEATYCSLTGLAPRKIDEDQRKRGNFLGSLALVSAVGGLLSFVIGSWFVLSAAMS